VSRRLPLGGAAQGRAAENYSGSASGGLSPAPGLTTAALTVKGACGVAARPDCVRPWTASLRDGGRRRLRRRDVPAARLTRGHDRPGWVVQPERRSDMEQESWRAEALCAQTDPEAFFPEKGGSTRDAKAVCRRCPVTAECLEWALANDQRYGVWGGTSAPERAALRRSRTGGAR
jgi:WhiB family transcriptional regulator, redox-sensing transcriptional regulator